MKHLAILERCPSVQVQLYFSYTLTFLAIVWVSSRYIILNEINEDRISNFCSQHQNHQGQLNIHHKNDILN